MWGVPCCALALAPCTAVQALATSILHVAAIGDWRSPALHFAAPALLAWSWVLQAGIVLSLLVVLVCVSTTVTTGLSLCAIATNGTC